LSVGGLERWVGQQLALSRSDRAVSLDHLAGPGERMPILLRSGRSDEAGSIYGLREILAVSH
jgi:hypothetical protein